MPHTYIRLYIPDHPLADKHGLVLEHRLVLSLKLGRWLRPDEHVHHLNEDRKDNRPENLVLTANGVHQAEFHNKGGSGQCDQCGSATDHCIGMVCRVCFLRRFNDTYCQPEDQRIMTGTELRALRQAARVSQEALADCMGISQAMLSFVETGRRRATQATLHRAAALVHEMKAEADAAFQEMSEAV